MADSLLIKAQVHRTEGIVWEFVDKDMRGDTIELSDPIRPEMEVRAGDTWLAQIVSRQRKVRNSMGRVILRLIMRERKVESFETITSIPGFWMEENKLRCVLIWLSNSRHVILIGDKGTGKSTFGYMLAEAMGWQTPCKIEIAAVKHAGQLLGSNTAEEGTTSFNKSYFLEYIERAIVAHESGMPGVFLVILDEWNRAHAKIKSPLHGCFDKTRQITIPTEEGSRTVIIPPNLVFVATANIGMEYAGAFSMDDADKSRFIPVKIDQMPTDLEVAMLVRDTGILESQALNVVRVAQALRRTASSRQISYAPSYREVEGVGVLVKNGVDLRLAVVMGMMGYYDGEHDAEGNPLQANSEYAKAHAALTMKGIASD